MAEITRDKFLADGEPGVGSEYHVGQFRLWRHQLDLRLEGGERFVQSLPLRFRQIGFGATRATHPRIDLVLDAVVIRRAQK